MDSPRLTYAPLREATHETEISALASVYRFVLDCRAKKEAAPESRPDAGKEINERSGKVIIPK